MVTSVDGSVTLHDVSGGLGGPADKLALARCLFAVAATDASISLAEESEIHRILNQLRIDPRDLTALRVQHRKFLPGLSG